MWIELHGMVSGKKVWLNLDNARKISRGIHRTETTIYWQSEDEAYFCVKETPEEIMKLTKEMGNDVTEIQYERLHLNDAKIKLRLNERFLAEFHPDPSEMLLEDIIRIVRGRAGGEP